MKRIALLLLLLSPASAWADASLFISPERGSYSVGELFEIRVLADTGEEFVNAAEADLDFNSEGLEVTKITLKGSILSSWSTPPEYSNVDGVIRFSGWTKEPYQGDSGLLLTVQFRAKKNIASNARFVAGAILAADGQSSNIITGMKSASFAIKSQQSSSRIIATTTEETAPPLVQPELSEFSGQMIEGERLILRGHADPNAKVRLYIERGGEQLLYSAMSAADGSFTFVTEERLRAGTYLISATSQRDGHSSQPSKTLHLNVAEKNFAGIVGAVVSLGYQLAILISILGLIGIGVGYILHQHSLKKARG